jgi:alcohol dehydrogenase class IV
MNIFYKAYCRAYQGVFRLAMPVLGIRVPELLQGENSVRKLPAFIKSKGISNILIVTVKPLLGMLAGLKEELEKAGIQYAIYDDTVVNPTIDNVEEALALYKKNRCEGIIAFGGGSAMDCAKGVGARIARPDKTMRQLGGLLKVGRKLPPLFAIPTTAGTGSEATVTAVITDSASHEKYNINDPHLVPPYAVLDPVLTKSLPKELTSTTGMDALTHAVEAFIGRSNTKETEKYALDAVKLIFENLKKAYDNGNDLVVRNNMQLAAFYAGIAFTRAYVGYVHALAHRLGGRYGTPHGLANAVLLPHVLELFGESAHKRLAILADAVGIDGATEAEKAKKFISAIREMNEYMGIPTKIKGIKEEDIPGMVRSALKEAHPLYPVPKLLGPEELSAMYYAIKE